MSRYQSSLNVQPEVSVEYVKSGLHRAKPGAKGGALRQPDGRDMSFKNFQEIKVEVQKKKEVRPKSRVVESEGRKSARKSLVVEASEASQTPKILNGVTEIQTEDPKFGTVTLKAKFENNRVNGVGEFSLPSKNLTLSGHFVESQLEGLGKLDSRNFTYLGQWNRSQFSGYGRIVSKNFALYEGMFVENLRDGIGVELYQNSDFYIGEFRRDQKHGLGIYFVSEGGFYYGFFAQGKREGFGQLVDGSGRTIYIGFWHEDLKHGRGTETYPEGAKFDGFFRDGLRSGPGLMEYSPKVVYIGYWEKGMKHGQGSVDVGSKTIAGVFRQDQFVSGEPVNPQLVMDLIGKQKLSSSIEEQLRSVGHSFRKVKVRQISELYVLLKESLVGFVYNLTSEGVIRQNTYLKLRNLLRVSKTFDNTIEEFQLALRMTPDIPLLETFLQPAFAELISPDTLPQWRLHHLSEIYVDQDFGDLNKKITLSVKGPTSTGRVIYEASKEFETLGLLVSHELVTGESQGNVIEGPVSNSEVTLRFFSSETRSWEKTLKCKAFPFFLLSDEEGHQEFLFLPLTMWTGHFLVGNEQNKRELVMFLTINQRDEIYSFGVDDVGTFTLAGSWNQQEASGCMLQKYHLEYQINYELTALTAEKISGKWTTTGFSGTFALRKNNGFKLVQEVVKVLEKNQSHTLPTDPLTAPYLKTYTEKSIASVLIKGAQGGVIIETDSVKSQQEDANLFNKYKKNKEDHVLLPVKIEAEPPIASKESPFVPEEPGKFERLGEDAKMIRMSLAQHNKKLIAENKKKENNRLNQSGFGHVLNNALKDLRTIDDQDFNPTEQLRLARGESISWIGTLDTLGKQEKIIIESMLIIGDRIDGVYTDEAGDVFELAGLFSARTRECEIIGLSTSKTKSIKIKGKLTDFEISGKIFRRPSNEAYSLINIKMFGIEGKLKMKLKSDPESDYFACLLRLTDMYLYAMAVIGKEYLILTGFLGSNGAVVEVSSTSKKIKTGILYETEAQKNRNDDSEKVLKLKNSEMEIDVVY